MSTRDYGAIQRYLQEDPEVRLWALNLIRTCRGPIDLDRPRRPGPADPGDEEPA